MNTILSFFGYFKIPKEAVQLSLSQEDTMKTAIELYEAAGKDNFVDLLKKQLKGQKTLTEFLQTGRMVVR